MAIEAVQQIVKVTDVDFVSITDTAEDTSASPTQYVREIRVYSPTDESGARTLVFTLRLVTTEAAKILLQAPVQNF